MHTGSGGPETSKCARHWEQNWGAKVEAISRMGTQCCTGWPQLQFVACPYRAARNAGRNAVRVNWSHLLCLQTQIFCVSVCHHNSSNKAPGDVHWCFRSVSCPVNKSVVLNLSNLPEGLNLDCWLEESNTNHWFSIAQWQFSRKANSFAVHLNCSVFISLHTSFAGAVPQTFGWSCQWVAQGAVFIPVCDFVLNTALDWPRQSLMYWCFWLVKESPVKDATLKRH